MTQSSAYIDALRMLARRELSEAQLRARLVEREHDRAEVDAALERLRDTGAVDDARVAQAYARTALKVKRRGRLRIQRELHEMGISREIVTEALASVFADVDERTLAAQALQKKFHGRIVLTSPAEYARAYQFLMRQGFSPTAVTAVLRQRRGRGE
jgi:regulatory protein